VSLKKFTAETAKDAEKTSASSAHSAVKCFFKSTEAFTTKELHKSTLEIVRPHFSERQDNAASLYKKLAKTERASNDIKTVVSAAYTGRVELLFVPIGIECWG
jgi:hypothetical protein